MNEPVKKENQDLEEVKDFDYLGSRVITSGDSGTGMIARLSKARYAYAKP